MSTDNLINSLMDIHPKGFDLSLDRITNLLNLLGDPHRKIPPVIHVAGTNGKGSTIAFCRALLESAGKSVHVHTSPHLVNWQERYRIGSLPTGKLVSDEMLEDAIARVAKANDGNQITVFEILSAATFILFSEQPADYCLIEVGLGGRFDATNVIDPPAICAITPVALDHQAYLGDTLAEIAFEKAGIIKPGSTAVIGVQDEEALEVIAQKAANCAVPTTFAQQDYDFYEQAGRFIYQDNEGLLDLPLPGLIGDHQQANAALAIAIVRQLALEPSHEQYESAMTNVAWPGRMQRLRHGKIIEQLGTGCDVWLDGGHNPAAGKVIAQTLEQMAPAGGMDTIMVCGMLTTKKADGYFQALNGVVDEVITVPVKSSDAGFDAADLAEISRSNAIRTSAADSLELALVELAGRLIEKPARILFAGSLYLAGDVLALNETPPT